MSQLNGVRWYLSPVKCPRLEMNVDDVMHYRSKIKDRKILRGMGDKIDEKRIETDKSWR